MAKRASLFAVPVPSPGQATASTPAQAMEVTPAQPAVPQPRPSSRAGKRVLSIYLDPLAWKQLRQLALQEECTTQSLGEEAINLLFMKHGLNRSA